MNRPNIVSILSDNQGPWAAGLPAELVALLTDGAELTLECWSDRQ